MKNFLSALVLSFLSCIAPAQVQLPSPLSPAIPSREHYGFYLSMSGGPVFGNISDNYYSGSFKMSGTGALFDFKIGGVIANNLILHATVLSQVLAGPKITISSGTGGKASDNLNVGESMIGGGFTYYIMPSNTFLSISAGLGNFSIIDNTNSSNNITTREGFSIQLKAGKEWWISSRWGLGLGLTYGKTKLTNKPTGGITEILNSNRFGIVFNATLN